MSKAVPWSTLVRTIGRPSVTFTAWPKAWVLSGPSPWSWYIASTASNSPDTARWNRLSAANGPGRRDAARARGSIAGAITRASSSPKRPASPACGFSPQTAMRGARSAEAPLEVGVHDRRAPR